MTPINESSPPSHGTPGNVPDIRALRLSRSKKDRPCDACRRRKTRCVIAEGATVCGFCRSHGKDCTFLEKPTPRRKKSDINGRRNSSSANSNESSPTHSTTLDDPSGGDMAVIRSVESDESFEPDTNDPTDLSAVMVRISPADFAYFAETFFQYLWPCYPVIEKEDVVGSLHSDSARSGQLLLAAICVVTSCLSTDIQGRLSMNDWSDLVRFVEKELERSTPKPNIKSLKAALLLFNYNVAKIRINSRNILAGRGIALSLQKATPKLKISSSSILPGVFPATWAYKIWSKALRSISPYGSQVESELDDQNIDPYGSSVLYENDHSSAVHFQQYLQLTDIVRQFIDTYPPNEKPEINEQEGRESLRQYLLKAKPIQMLLKQWFTAVSSSQAFDIDQVHTSLAGAAASLQMAYYTAEILLHRQMISALVGNDDAQFVDICRPAARTRLISAMDYINRLRASHLQGFWFCLAADCFLLIVDFGNMLMNTSISQAEEAFFAERMIELRWTLRANARYASFLEDTLHVLDKATLN